MLRYHTGLLSLLCLGAQRKGMVIIMKDLVCNYKLGPKFKEVVKPLMGRLFENVYIYITNNCNMYCAHCYLGNRLIERQEMPISNVIAHLKFWKELGASKVCFLGGEPTLYPFLKEAVDYAHRIGYKKVIINTNLSDVAYSVIKDYSVDDFTYSQTSLDGAVKETHEKIRGNGSFDNTINSIIQLAQKGYDVRIIMTVNKYNISEIIPMIELSEKLGASLIKFHIMSEIGNADKKAKLGVSPSSWITACDIIQQYAGTHTNRKIKISFQPAYAEFNNQKKYSEYGYKGCLGKLKNRMSVFPDGKCYICSFLFDYNESFAQLKDGIIEINNKSVETLFENNKCLSCVKCQFDGCIAEEMIYNKSVCNEEGLIPICRLWKIEL